MVTGSFAHGGSVIWRSTGALLAELRAWPKPGLVSLVDSGSHADMDAGTFRASANALRPFFVALAAKREPENAEMEELRNIGKAAERAMLAATGGVNTHRGGLFGLGLLCAAAGALSHGEKPRNPRRRARSLRPSALEASDILSRAASRDKATVPWRGGGTGWEGARAEAAGGFSARLPRGLARLEGGEPPRGWRRERSLCPGLLRADGRGGRHEFVVPEWSRRAGFRS